MRRKPMEPKGSRELYRVSELARRTGVSVRALHHYDAIGLLSPARRTAAGHRLYGERDVQRLLHIRALAQLGFSLDEVRACLERPDLALPRVLELHLARLTTHIAESQRLCQRLASLLAGLRADETSVGDLLATIEAM